MPVLVPVHEDVDVYVTLMFGIIRGGGGGKVEAASFGSGGAGGGTEAVDSVATVVGGDGGGTAVVDGGGGATVVALSIGAGTSGGGGGEVVWPASLGAGGVVMGGREVGTWIWPSESCWATWAILVGRRLVVRAKVKTRRGLGVRIADILLMKFCKDGVYRRLVGAGNEPPRGDVCR